MTLWKQFQFDAIKQLQIDAVTQIDTMKTILSDWDSHLNM